MRIQTLIFIENIGNVQILLILKTQPVTMLKANYKGNTWTLADKTDASHLMGERVSGQEAFLVERLTQG